MLYYDFPPDLKFERCRRILCVGLETSLAIVKSRFKAKISITHPDLMKIEGIEIDEETIRSHEEECK